MSRGKFSIGTSKELYVTTRNKTCGKLNYQWSWLDGVLFFSENGEGLEG